MGAARGFDEAALALARAGFEESLRATRATLTGGLGPLVEAAGLLAQALRAGRRVLCFGNGGSAAQAEHLAAELAGRYAHERPGLPAQALGSSSADLTAIANDYGYERVFARLLAAHGEAGDVAVALSTSGDSANVVAAVEEARRLGLRSVGLCGRRGGKLAGLVDVALVVPSDSTPRIQEVHAVALHVLCELVEAALTPEPRRA